MKFSELKRLSFCNSPELPYTIKIWDKKTETWVYKEWTGIGWIDCDSSDDAVEITDD